MNIPEPCLTALFSIMYNEYYSSTKGSWWKPGRTELDKYYRAWHGGWLGKIILSDKFIEDISKKARVADKYNDVTGSYWRGAWVAATDAEARDMASPPLNMGIFQVDINETVRRLDRLSDAEKEKVRI
jgi:hypothetical protein